MPWQIGVFAGIALVLLWLISSRLETLHSDVVKLVPTTHVDALNAETARAAKLIVAALFAAALRVTERPREEWPEPTAIDRDLRALMEKSLIDRAIEFTTLLESRLPLYDCASFEKLCDVRGQEDREFRQLCDARFSRHRAEANTSTPPEIAGQ